ncbi:MAG: glycosyltransferase family 4 protein, partial [Candidatus Cloacimonetes bacterium]|nr:glycosyltransferase family 4 protein [Candidatus Cloacimonadota bacterium]
MKKVLIIPSWYPYPKLPHAGNFIINQANALADNGLAEISILNWGQLEYQLVLRSPLKSLSRLYNYSGSKSGMSQWNNGISEYRTPHLTWTHHLLGGNLDALVPKLKLLAGFD